MKEGNLETILPKIMEGFKQNTNPVLRAQAAIALFGREGQKLIPFLIKGKAGLAEMAAAAKQLNIPLEDLMAGVEAGKAMKELSHSVESAKNAVAAAILPAFVPMVKAISGWVRANRSLLRQVALPAFLGLITTAVISLGVALLGVLGPFSLLAGAIIAAGVAIYQNWGSIISWLDKEVPGLTDTIAKAYASIVKFASNTMESVAKGFKEGGLTGGVKAMVEAFKTAWSGTGEWFANLFRNVSWSDIGTSVGAALSEALMVMARANIQLGEMIITQFLALHDWLMSLNWADIGEALGTAVGIAAQVAAKIAFAPLIIGKLMADQMMQGMKDADWAGLIKYIALWFLTLPARLTLIGIEAGQGFVKGIWNSIPGAAALGNAVQTFAQVRVPNAVQDVADTFNQSGAFLPQSTLNPYGNLLTGLGAGPQTAKVESNTKIQVLLPPGATATATTDQTGGRAPEVNVGVNGAGMAMP
jgi:hypothetical protein